MLRLASLLLALVLGLVALAACGGTSPSADPATSPNRSPGSAGDVGRYLRISEIGLGPDGYVTLTNFTDQPADLATLFLCQADGCVDLPAYVVEPGASARITAGNGNGLDDVAHTGADLELQADDGEVALYSLTDLDDLRSLHAYLEWGSTPHEITQRAIDAGLWLQGSYAPTLPTATRLYQNDAGLWLFE
jgi:hypothetical protein